MSIENAGVLDLEAIRALDLDPVLALVLVLDPDLILVLVLKIVEDIREEMEEDIDINHFFIFMLIFFSFNS